MTPLRKFTLLLAFLSLALAVRSQDFEKPDTPPVPVRTPPPSYPADLKRDGVSGMVVVNVIVEVDGSVADVEVRKSTNSAFDEPAVEAVKNWRFKPAQKDGNAIRSKVALPLKFSAE